MPEGLVLALLALFWLSAAWLAWVFVLYPLGMLLLSKLRPRPLVRRLAPYEPTVAFVMAAYNEEAVISDRLQNYQDIDYPVEKRQFLVGSDASTDATDTIVASFASRDDSIHSVRYERCGKTRIVYELAEIADAEIVIFTDADVLLDRDGLRRIVDCFADPLVGGVIGRMVYTDADSNAGNIGQKKYLELENCLRRAEALVWTTVGPRGECFAVRKGAYTPLTNYEYSDDLNLVLTIPQNGYRVWYEPALLIRETSRRSLSTEFRRRLRMGQQAAATLTSYPYTRWPWSSWVAFQVWSHKLLRIMSAIPITLLAMSSFMLAFEMEAFRFLALTLCTWFGVLAVGWVLDTTRIRFRPLQYPLYFTSMIVSLTIGSVRGVLHGGLAKWSSNRVE